MDADSMSMRLPQLNFSLLEPKFANDLSARFRYAGRTKLHLFSPDFNALVASLANLSARLAKNLPAAVYCATSLSVVYPVHASLPQFDQPVRRAIR
jgi:hypothetical protein